jgi:hypothetical protein
VYECSEIAGSPQVLKWAKIGAAAEIIKYTSRVSENIKRS